MAETEEKKKRTGVKVEDENDKKSSKKNDDAETAEDDEEEAIHTSDPEARVEGVAVGDVEPDPSTETHASDSPEYDFPPAGDVNVEPPEDPTALEEGETLAPIQPDARVVLADTEAVPEELHGHPALVTAITEEEDEDGEPFQSITVRTRDEHNSTIVGLTRDDFTEVHPGGTGTRGFGP